MSPEEALRRIDLSWDLPHEPAKVWRALTEPALIAQWLLPCDLTLEAGRPFSFRAEPTQWWDGIVESEVTELEPGRRLRYAWRTHGPNGLDTQVTWILTPIEGGTRLALEHTGFRPSDTFAFAGAGKGWEHNVTQRLSKVLATPA